MPAISQCPVVVSLPGEARAHFPNAAPGISERANPANGSMFANPNLDKLGSRSGRIRARLPNVLLPASPYDAASGIAPIPTLSRTIHTTRLKFELIADALQLGGNSMKPTRFAFASAPLAGGGACGTVPVN